MDVYEYYKGLIAFRKAHGACAFAFLRLLCTGFCSLDQYHSGNAFYLCRTAGCSENLASGLLSISNADAAKEDLVKMNKLSSAIVFTSQGVPFMLAGEEMFCLTDKYDFLSPVTLNQWLRRRWSSPLRI